MTTAFTSGLCLQNVPSTRTYFTFDLSCLCPYVPNELFPRLTWPLWVPREFLVPRDLVHCFAFIPLPPASSVEHPLPPACSWQLRLTVHLAMSTPAPPSVYELTTKHVQTPLQGRKKASQRGGLTMVPGGS